MMGMPVPPKNMASHCQGYIGKVKDESGNTAITVKKIAPASVGLVMVKSKTLLLDHRGALLAHNHHSFLSRRQFAQV